MKLAVLNKEEIVSKKWTLTIQNREEKYIFKEQIKNLHIEKQVIN